MITKRKKRQEDRETNKRGSRTKRLPEEASKRNADGTRGVHGDQVRVESGVAKNDRREPREKRVSQISNQLKSRDPLERADAVEQLAAIDDPVAFRLVMKGLWDRNPTVRVTSAEALGRMRDRGAVSALTTKLIDPNSEVRFRVTESLGLILSGSKRIPRSLTRRFQDADELVRIAAAESAILIGDRDVVPMLRKAINDPSALVRSYFAEALGRLGNKKEVAKLEKKLQNEPSEIAKVGISLALFLLGRHKFLEDLLSLLESRDYRVRCATANAVSQIYTSELDARTVVSSLRRALRSETTVAARSSIRSSLASLRRRLRHNR